MSKVKDCPFCGLKAIKYVYDSKGLSGDRGYLATICCPDRDCGGKIQKWALKEKWATESAEKAWNNRV
ncbi:MAG: hypothetical protein ACRC3H_13205 [Lachnospiraceae bacterium]